MAITVKKSPGWTSGQGMKLTGTGPGMKVPAAGGGGGGGGGGSTALPGGYTIDFKKSEYPPDAEAEMFGLGEGWAIDYGAVDTSSVTDGMTITQSLTTHFAASLWSTGPVPVYPAGSTWFYVVVDSGNNWVDGGTIEERNPDTGIYRPKNIAGWVSPGTYKVIIGDSTLYDGWQTGYYNSELYPWTGTPYILINWIIT